MPKEKDLIKLNTLKRYIKDIHKLRASNTATNTLRIRFNSILKKIITNAAKATRQDKRSTIMPRDIDPQIKALLGNKKLNPQEIFTQLKKQSAVELGQLLGLITDHVASQKKTK